MKNKTSKQLLEEMAEHTPGEPGFILLFTELAKRALAYDDVETVPNKVWVSVLGPDDNESARVGVKRSDALGDAPESAQRIYGPLPIYNIEHRKSRHFTNAAVEAGTFPKHGGPSKE